MRPSVELLWTLVGTARVVCAAGSVLLSGVRPSVRLSVCLSHPAATRRSPISLGVIQHHNTVNTNRVMFPPLGRALRRVCYCEPGEQERAAPQQRHANAGSATLLAYVGSPEHRVVTITAVCLRTERVPQPGGAVHELRLRADGPVPRHAGGRGRPQRGWGQRDRP